MRDINMIRYKFLYIMNIKQCEDIEKELKNWDMWGPFAICIFLSLALYSKNELSSAHGIFSTVFFLASIGGFVITLNARLLGSRQSIFQAVSIVGYCLGPIVVGCLALALRLYYPLCLLLNIGCVYWSVRCSLDRVASDIGRRG